MRKLWSQWWLLGAVCLCVASVCSSAQAMPWRWPQFLGGCNAQIHGIYLAYGLLGKPVQDPRFYLEPHVGAALKAALEDYKTEGNPLAFDYVPDSRAEDFWWQVNYRHSYVRFGGVGGEPYVLTQLHDNSGRLTNEFMLTAQGKRFLFRKTDLEYPGRLRYAADRLNHFLGQDTSVRTRLSVINENGQQTGLLSDWAEGTELPADLPSSEVLAMVERGEIDPVSFSTAQAFEFLVNHSECSNARFVITPEKKVKVFEREKCLGCCLNQPPPHPDRFYLGWTLPLKYSRSFVEALRNNGPEKLKEFTSLELDEAETRSLLFRRTLILKDVELRGAAAYFP